MKAMAKHGYKSDYFIIFVNFRLIVRHPLWDRRRRSREKAQRQHDESKAPKAVKTITEIIKSN